MLYEDAASKQKSLRITRDGWIGRVERQAPRAKERALRTATFAAGVIPQHQNLLTQQDFSQVPVSAHSLTEDRRSAIPPWSRPLGYSPTEPDKSLQFQAIQLSKRKRNNKKNQSSPNKKLRLVPWKNAFNAILQYLKNNMPLDSNYCVAALQYGDLIISKVNGVTAATSAINGLQEMILEQGLHENRDIYLAQKYNTEMPSNHSEMCILAAARMLKMKVLSMGCTGPNCPYCAAMLSHEGVPSANEIATRQQIGWAHPWENLFWGSSVNNQKVNVQVADLKRYLQAPKEYKPIYAKATIQESAGRSTKWL